MMVLAVQGSTLRAQERRDAWPGLGARLSADWVFGKVPSGYKKWVLRMAFYVHRPSLDVQAPPPAFTRMPVLGDWAQRGDPVSRDLHSLCASEVPRPGVSKLRPAATSRFPPPWCTAQELRTLLSFRRLETTQKNSAL